MDTQTAAKKFIARQNRTEHPDGEFDNGGRWYPSDAEHQRCCNAVRSPSRAWPYSYLVHCRTAEHIANLTGVPAKDIKREANKIRKELETQTA